MALGRGQLLLRINGDHGLACCLRHDHFSIDVFELCIAIRVARAMATSADASLSRLVSPEDRERLVRLARLRTIGFERSDAPEVDDRIYSHAKSWIKKSRRRVLMD
jgi:hypothetical protein